MNEDSFPEDEFDASWLLLLLPPLWAALSWVVSFCSPSVAMIGIPLLQLAGVRYAWHIAETVAQRNVHLRGDPASDTEATGRQEHSVSRLRRKLFLMELLVIGFIAIGFIGLASLISTWAKRI